MFMVSFAEIINIIIISIGIGICGMNFLQVSFGARLKKQVTVYFQLFFTTLFLYIGNHLLRLLLEGNPLEAAGIAIRTVTFLEFIFSGVMAWLFSLLTLYVSKSENARTLNLVLLVVLITHILIMTISQFTGLCYTFDSNNVYHRSGGYLLSNLSIFVMLAMDIYLLIRYRNNFNPNIRPAFWIYIIAPIVAMVIQTISGKIQFIILATVVAAVFMSRVIMRDLINKYEDQEKTSARIGAELNMATAIQASQLPRLFPAFPNRPEFDLFASMTPAKEVGGDFYDFFLVDDNHIGLVMADVSGKGVPAALFMMISRVLIKSRLQNGESPGEALENVNNQLCENNDTGLFVTVWVAVLEISTGKGVAANAGHEHPVIRRAGGQYELITYRHSPAVACMEGIPFKEHEFVLKPGDSLFVYTDGVAEATNANDELFGTDRMLEALNRNPDALPEQVLAGVMDGINEFVAGAEQFDDITMLCLRYNGI
ncbi:PP2C family protein-serine/threonine phosphatase [Butyrivibrio sp. VCD2006]|uniref:PP2C family protein-serine/threonine phosphatase n=1 Tax=Butyrivibrio sp. VCD2006 TaxID=1280664 RepID=UPI00040B592B|nr:PP2C family protein-serine/threonine phosphatase [Butyrivibrio sp. VCD2006]